MEQYSILLGYFEKQVKILEKIYKELITVDLSVYEKQFLFALRLQQFYTGLEDLFKQIAKGFENHIETLTQFHKEILIRMNTEIPKIRPAVISTRTFMFLDKLRAFRHFIRHAYDCEFEKKELLLLQDRLKEERESLKQELEVFRLYVQKLAAFKSDHHV